MEQSVYTPEVLDLRRQRGVWDRVSPQIPAYPDRPAVQAMAVQMNSQTGMTPAARAESTLPGAEIDPCCMGSAAQDVIEVLMGFAEEELSECRHLQALSCQGPGWAAGRLREMAADHARHAKRLFAVYYLITGTCYTPVVQTDRIYVGKWCPALRERYHAAACSGMNYRRAAEGTTDVCLRTLLDDLSEASYRQAEVLLQILERSMGGH